MEDDLKSFENGSIIKNKLGIANTFTKPWYKFALMH